MIRMCHEREECLHIRSAVDAYDRTITANGAGSETSSRLTARSTLEQPGVRLGSLQPKITLSQLISTLCPSLKPRIPWTYDNYILKFHSFLKKEGLLPPSITPTQIQSLTVRQDASRLEVLLNHPISGHSSPLHARCISQQGDIHTRTRNSSCQSDLARFQSSSL